MWREEPPLPDTWMVVAADGTLHRIPVEEYETDEEHDKMSHKAFEVTERKFTHTEGETSLDWGGSDEHFATLEEAKEFIIERLEQQATGRFAECMLTLVVHRPIDGAADSSIVWTITS